MKLVLGINEHKGGHPRKGIVDLIPIHPITENTSLEDCADVAIRISENLVKKTNELRDGKTCFLDTFLFGHADLPLKRSLVTMRKHVDWYSSKDKGVVLYLRYLTKISQVGFNARCL